MSAKTNDLSSKINKTLVVGAGQMGGGIVQVFAMGGLETLVYDESVQAVQSCLKRCEKQLARLVEKEELSEKEKNLALSRIKPISTLAEAADVDLALEAIVEKLEPKTSLFCELERICKSETLFASNTSSISITKIAAAVPRAAQVIGMHFMNPAPIMPLVEIIRGLQTDDATYTLIRQLTLQLGKTPVAVSRDYPGFIVNRILVPMLNEAFYVLMEGTACAEEIDQAMKLGTNQPMGPLELADFVGLDICLAICRVLHQELGEDKYRPCPLLIKHVEAGWLGQKTGQGVYKYPREP